MINDEGRGNRIFKTQEMEQDHRSARNSSTRNRFCYVETGFPVEFIDNCKPKHGLEANLIRKRAIIQRIPGCWWGPAHRQRFLYLLWYSRLLDTYLVMQQKFIHLSNADNSRGDCAARTPVVRVQIWSAEIAAASPALKIYKYMIL